MANSGSFTTSSYDSRCLEFSWSVGSQSIENNTTTIAWVLKGAGGSTSTYYVSGNFKVNILGQTVYSSSTRINLYNGTTIASGTFTITHNGDGSKSFDAYAEAGIYYIAVNCSGSGSWDLPSIPRQANITGASDFDDEQNPTITYSNSAGNSVSSLQACISLTGSIDDISYRDISKTGSSYTFNLTETERNVLRSATTTSNTRTVMFFVRTIIGGNTYYSTLTRTLTLVNATPTFESANISYQDTNTTITAITGNDQQIVRNNSNLKVTFTSAIAKKGASISSYVITFNGSSQTKTTASTIDYGTVNSVSNLSISIKVIDTRGNNITASKTITILDWVNPTAIITAGRVNNYEDSTNLKANVTISSVNSKNSIQQLKYRYKKTSDTSYSSYINLSNNVQANISINKLYSWDFQVYIQDKFGNTTYNFIIAKGMPLVFFDIDKISVGINKFPINNNSLDVDKINGKSIIDLIYPVGSIYMSINSTNPTTIFGGTWVAWGQGRVPVGVNSSGTFNGVEKTGGSETHTLSTSELPSHDHSLNGHTHSWSTTNTGDHTHAKYGWRYAGSGSYKAYSWERISADGNAGSIDSSTHSHSGTTSGASGNTGSSGSGSAHNNLQPYITCYMWKRTA